MSATLTPPPPLESRPTEQTVPWPSEFELEARREFAEIRAHQLRQDSLLMTLQLNAQRAERNATALALRLEAQLAELIRAVRALKENGYG
jgi:hypothetical protein